LNQQCLRLARQLAFDHSFVTIQRLFILNQLLLVTDTDNIHT